MIVRKLHKKIIRIFIILVSYGYIIFRILQTENFNDLICLPAFSIPDIALLSFTILLMPVNWGIEAVKWKYLVRKLERISFLSSVRAILAGVTVSVFTPNRIGEFGGRIFVLKEENRGSAILSTIVGSMSQLLVTIITGTLSCLLFFVFYTDELIIGRSNAWIAVTAFLVISIAFLVIYLNVKIFQEFAGRFRFLKRFNSHFEILGKYSRDELSIVFVYSLLRYFVFVTQFYFCLLFFGIDLPVITGYVIISVTYLLIALIPSVTLAEIGIRGSVSLAVIGLFSSDSTAIVAAAVLVWLINIAIPAIAGSFVFYRMKV